MANNTISYSKLISIFRDIAARNKMITDFGFGQPSEVGASRKMLFPFLWVEPDQTRTVYSENGYLTDILTFRFYVMDKIKQGDPNWEETLSDTKYTLDTIISEITQHKFYRDMNISLDGDVIMQPYMEQFDDNTNGWIADISFKIPIRYTPCNSPIEPITGYTVSLNSNISEYRLIGADGPQGFQGVHGADGIGATGISYNRVTANFVSLGQMASNTYRVGVLNAQSGGATSISAYTSGKITTSTIYYGSTNPGIGLASGTVSARVSINDQFRSPDLVFISTNTGLTKSNVSNLTQGITFSTGDKIGLFFYGYPGSVVNTMVPNAEVCIDFDSDPIGIGFQGFQGSGYQGQVGNQGFQGTGVQGLQGNIGSQGNEGTQGLQGQGITGSQGSQGIQGGVGSTGSIGLQGPIGLQGSKGFQGNIGVTGSQGFQGTVGSNGNQGSQGFQGAQGLQGNIGSTGSQGQQGIVGITGSQGPQGSQGFQGLQGIQGFQGFQGNIGTTGNQGLQGTTGSNGNQGFQGTVGSNGNQGFQGFQGSGTTGSQGFQGTVGSNGNQGFQGFQGSGTTGSQGFQGLVGSNTPISITYSTALSMMNSGSLSNGSFYLISDRGDRGILLQSTGTGSFSPSGVRYMLVPSEYFPTTSGGNVWKGIWNISKPAPSINDLYIWGGKVWKAKSTNIGTSLDSESLDPTYFDLISKSSFSNNEYIVKEFSITYEFDNDWIAEQRDEKGNVVGTNFSNWFGTNPCDLTDWNLSIMFNNKCPWGIYNNLTDIGSNNGSISNNEAFYISNNSINSITLNKCFRINDNVSKNYLGGEIYGNICLGGLEGNTNVMSISVNESLSITYNIIQYISYNYNIIYGINNNYYFDSINFNLNILRIEENNLSTSTSIIERNSNISKDSGSTGGISYNDCSGSISNNVDCASIENISGTGGVINMFSPNDSIMNISLSATMSGSNIYSFKRTGVSYSVPLSINSTIKDKTGSVGVSGYILSATAGGVQWIEPSSGPQGVQGPIGNTGNDGPQGVQGPIGNTGNDGPQGVQGPIGNTGNDGPQGVQGPIGNTGGNGFVGEMVLYYQALNVPANSTSTASLFVPTNNTAFSINLGTRVMRVSKGGIIRTGALVTGATISAGTMSMWPTVNGVAKPTLLELNTSNNRSYTGVYNTYATFSSNDTIGVTLKGTSLSPTTLDVTAWISIQFL